MPDFFRIAPQADDAFIRGAARLMYANSTSPFPASIGRIVNLSTYDAISNTTDVWYDLGSTKTGIQITVNNAEETFDVDQIVGDIDTRPTTWEATVGTQLAEMTLERLQIAWEASAIATAGTERNMGFGNPLLYTQRRMAVLFQRPSGKIRAFVFRKAQRTPQESAVTFNKTGEQISVPLRFRALPDTSVSDPYQRLFMIYDQI